MESDQDMNGGVVSETSVRRSVPLHGLLLLFLGVVPLSGFAADLPAPATKPLPPDAELRKRLIGVWQDHYKGTRTMAVRTNGTAVMLVELKGLNSRLYARRMEFDMEWSIEDGRLKKHTTGGRPSGRVKFILDVMGDQVDERILELTDERLRLLDADGKAVYDWRRLKRVSLDGNEPEEKKKQGKPAF